MSSFISINYSILSGDPVKQLIDTGCMIEHSRVCVKHSSEEPTSDSLKSTRPPERDGD